MGSVKEEKDSRISRDKMLGMLLSSWQIHAKQVAELELAPLTSVLEPKLQLFCLKQMNNRPGISRGCSSLGGMDVG